MARRMNIPTLPEDLIISDILIRLPTKSIGRFRCVSKSWRSSLSRPKFARSHLQRRINGPDDQHVLLATNTGDDNGLRMIPLTLDGSRNLGVTRMVSHPYDSGRRIFELGPSCHGLVLLTLRDRYPPGKFCNILLNPITGEAVDFQDCFSEFDWHSRLGFGLGYDSVSDDYKVVSYDTSANVDVYSLKTKTWRSVANIPYCCNSTYHVTYSCNGLHGVFIDSHIYWLRIKDEKFFVLAAFNLGSEEFEEVPLPSGMNRETPIEICVLDGFLALVFREPHVLHVWVMKEHGVQDSWTNVGSIKHPRRPLVGGQMIGSIFRVVCRLHGGDDDEFVLECDSRKFFAYNLRSNKWRFLDVYDLPFSYDDELITFRESLVSPIS